MTSAEIARFLEAALGVKVHAESVITTREGGHREMIVTIGQRIFDVLDHGSDLDLLAKMVAAINAPAKKKK